MIKSSKFAVNLLIFSVTVFIFVSAYRLYEGDGGQLKINDQLEININASTKKNTKPISSWRAVESKNKGVNKKDIVDPYDWEVDSYWVTGKTAEDFCSAQKNARESQYPSVLSLLVRTDVRSKEEYIPSRMVYFRYKCYFKDKLIN